jgi:beta-hydroxyacyl-ACP dehydratase FabZ
MDINAIVKCIPHRYPFLLVDRILEMEAGRRIVAIKNVTMNEHFFQGHFPSAPVMPGVLIVEAMAQTGAVLLLHDMKDRDSRLLLFTGIDKARFRRPVVPGDQLRFTLDVLKRRTSVFKLKAIAEVDGQLAAEAEILSSLVNRPGS